MADRFDKAAEDYAQSRSPLPKCVYRKRGRSLRSCRDAFVCSHPKMILANGQPMAVYGSVCRTCTLDKTIPAPSGAPEYSVMFLTQATHRQGPTDDAIRRLEEVGWHVAQFPANSRAPLWDIPKNVDSPAMITGPSVVLRWEEGGETFVNAAWRDACAWCHSRGIIPMQIDWSYFNHYRMLLVDPYEVNGTTSIHRTWPSLSTEPQWHLAGPLLLHYRQYMADEWKTAGELGPVPGTEPGYVLVYVQFSSYLSNLPASSYAEWAQKAQDAITAAGQRVVWKNSRAAKVTLPDGAKVFIEADGIPHLNTRLLRYAKHVVVISSSVTNEAVLRGLPVVTAGRGWHAGLGVFAEAKDWPDLAVTPQVDAAARGKWINWWIKRQFDPKRIGQVLKRFVVSPDQAENAAYYTPVGLGNILMAVPGMKAFREAVGNDIHVVAGRSMTRGYSEIFSHQPWAKHVSWKHLSLDDYDLVTAAAFPTEKKMIQDYNGPAIAVQTGRAAGWPHEVYRDAVPARRLGFTGILPSAKIRVPPVPDKFMLPASYVVVGMDCTDGPTWSKRRWPHWRAFTDLWQAKHQLPLVFLGVTPVDWANGSGIWLVGKTSPLEAASIINEADALVGIDGGLSHVAAAVRTPSVLLYGPTTTLQNGPWQGSITALSAHVSCRPCIFWPEWSSCKDCRCMSEITPGRVVKTLENVLERHGQPVRAETCFEQVLARVNIGKRIGAPAAQSIHELAHLWEILEEMRPAVVVEIGVLRGGWLYIIAPACAEHTAFIGIDPSANNRRSRVESELKQEGHEIHWLLEDSHDPRTLVRLHSVLEGRQIDVLHIDGDHSKEGVLADWAAYEPLVRPGGLVLLHDTANPTEQVAAAFAELQRCPPPQVDTFQLVYNVHDTIPLGLGIIRKKAVL